MSDGLERALAEARIEDAVEMDPQELARSEAEYMDLLKWLDNLNSEDPSVKVYDGKHVRRISRAVELQRRWEEEVTSSVKAAREAGNPWWVIAMALGVSPKEAEERYATLPD